MNYKANRREFVFAGTPTVHLVSSAAARAPAVRRSNVKPVVIASEHAIKYERLADDVR